MAKFNFDLSDTRKVIEEIVNSASFDRLIETYMNENFEFSEKKTDLNVAENINKINSALTNRRISELQFDVYSANLYIAA